MFCFNELHFVLVVDVNWRYNTIFWYPGISRNLQGGILVDTEIENKLLTLP